MLTGRQEVGRSPRQPVQRGRSVGRIERHGGMGSAGDGSGSTTILRCCHCHGREPRYWSSMLPPACL